MKVRFLSLVAAVALFTACSTPNYTSTSSNAAYSTPADLQTSFATQYPNATNVTWSAYDATTVPVDWEMSGWSAVDGKGHTAAFDMDNQKYYSWYDASGNWVGSSYAVSDYTQLPAPVNATIKDKYGDYTIDKVQREMWKDRMAYEVKLKNGDKKVKLLLDDQGNVLKEKNKD